MTVNSHSAEGNGRQGVTTSITLSKIAHGFQSILARFAAKSKALQMARMLSTLSNMSDYQLAQIGIQRSDIPQYARTLMAEE